MSNYLLPHHQAKLQNSGLSPEAISARGYKTLSTKVEVERLSFSRSQATASFADTDLECGRFKNS